jgi:KUP system potassium uptake protein
MALILTPFFAVDTLLFSTAIMKIPDGGWLPLGIGLLMLTVFLTWSQGREVVMARRRGVARKLETFVENLQPNEAPRVSGTAIYLSNLRAVVPTTMVNNLRHNKILHERILILHINNEEEPRVPEENRLTVKPLQHGFWQVTLHYGFMERPNVMEDLQTYLLADCPLEADDTSFFLGHDVYVEGDMALKPIWREKLFLWLANGAAGMSDYFRIPTERVVEFGVRIRV